MSQKVAMIPELVHHVISSLLPDADRATLANCARVSQVFSPRALRELWKCLPDVCPLWGLLPSSHQRLRRHYVSVAPIVDVEWARLIYYANLVVSVDKLQDTLLESIDLFALAGILGRLRGEPLLPRLRKLTWGIRTDQESHHPYLLHFLPNTLLSVTFPDGDTAEDEPSEEDYGTASALQQAHERVPDLPELSTNNAVFPCVLRAVARFGSLRKLWLQSVRSTPALVAICGRLEQLEFLYLEFVPRSGSAGTDSIQVAADAPSVGFNALREICVRGKVVDAVTILAAIQSPHLHTTELRLTWERTLNAGAFAALDLSRWEHTMRILKIYVDVFRTARDPLPTFSSVFEPFYSLHGLWRVDIAACSPNFELGDRDIADIAGAWQRLSALSIITSRLEAGRAAPPHLDSLWAFVENCPDLYSVTLDDLDFSAVLDAEDPEEMRRLDARSSEHQLVYLHLRSPTVADEKKDRCKTCLERMFPYACELRLDSKREG